MKLIGSALSGVTLILALFTSFWSTFFLALSTNWSNILGETPIVIAILFSFGIYGAGCIALLRKRPSFLTITPTAYLILAGVCFIGGVLGRWWMTN